MRIITLLLIVITSLTATAQTKIELSDLEITNFQVESTTLIKNKLYIATYQNEGTATIDLLDLETNTLEKDFLTKYGAKVTFGNTNMYKDKNDNLWIGDINSVYKIEPSGKFTSLYEGIKLPDSTYFEIKNFTADEEGNIYFSKENSRILVSGVDDKGIPYRWEKKDVELMKYDGKSLKTLHTFDNISVEFSDIEYFEGKIYCSFFGEDPLRIFDLESNEVEFMNYDMPFESLDWEEIKYYHVNNIFELNNKLYFFLDVIAIYSNFGAFMVYDPNTKEYEYYSLPRSEDDFIESISNFTVFNNAIFCEQSVYDGKPHKFHKFENGEFSEVEIGHLNPMLITSKAYGKDQSENNYPYEQMGYYHIKDGMQITENGDLYGGSNRGLIVLKNFLTITDVENDLSNNGVTYPNPTVGNITVKFNNKFPSEFSYEVISVTGEVVLTDDLGYLTLNNNSINLDISNVANGSYSIKVFSNQEEFISNIVKVK
ncbi:MAG: T9SS type A sorting domain-containing protein [Candidatus Kapaibacterium sp.]